MNSKIVEYRIESKYSNNPTTLVKRINNNNNVNYCHTYSDCCNSDWRRYGIYQHLYILDERGKVDVCDIICANGRNAIVKSVINDIVICESIGIRGITFNISKMLCSKIIATNNFLLYGRYNNIFGIYDKLVREYADQNGISNISIEYKEDIVFIQTEETQSGEVPGYYKICEVPIDNDYIYKIK